MQQKMRTVEMGQVRFSILNAGNLTSTVSEMFAARMGDMGLFGSERLDRPVSQPTQSILLRVKRASIIVDLGDFQRMTAPGWFHPPEEYLAPAPLRVQLESVGVGLKEITDVVITHLHFDHFAGVTIGEGRLWEREYVPAFPRARYYVPKKDWEMPRIEQARSKNNTDIINTLEVLRNHGLLEFSEGWVKLADGIEIIPTPGESPGHQIVRVHSEGRSLLCVGDLFHFPFEVEHPEIMPIWADARSNLESRRMVISMAIKENARVIPAHMHLGHIRRSDGKIVWVDSAQDH